MFNISGFLCAICELRDLCALSRIEEEARSLMLVIGILVCADVYVYGAGGKTRALDELGMAIFNFFSLSEIFKFLGAGTLF